MVSHPPPLLEVHNGNGDELSEDDDNTLQLNRKEKKCGNK
jgi:hypothetical protein